MSANPIELSDEAQEILADNPDWTTLRRLIPGSFNVVKSEAWVSWPPALQEAVREFVRKGYVAFGQMRSMLDAPIYDGKVANMTPIRDRAADKVPGRKAVVKTIDEIVDAL